MIQLRILGSRDLRGPDGQTVLSVLSRPQRLTLFSYLVLTANGVFRPRDSLVRLFWPDSDPERGRASLRTALSGLRKSLGPGVLTTRGDDEVGIAAGVVSCDAREFVEALDRGELEAAWRSYSGPFLEGIAFPEAPELDRWLDDERARLARRAVEAAAGLSHRDEGRGALLEAMDWAREALLIEPLSESGVSRLMRLMARAGDREGALRSYGEFAARLTTELDLEPAAETRALAESIRSGSSMPVGTVQPGPPVPATSTVVTAQVPGAAPMTDGQEPREVPALPASRTVGSPAANRPHRTLLATLTVSLAAFIVGAALWGSLRAEGVMAEGERVILADFADASGEGIGDAVTEALRIDLLESSFFELVETVDIAPTLALMRVDAGAALTAERAREVAIRDGIAAVVEGEVASAGSGYLITATLRAAESGRSLAALRVTADGPGNVIASIDRLSEDLRERSGEPLRRIRAGKPLEQVTTSSLEALRLYTEAAEILYERNDAGRSAELLSRALAHDSSFAMAWRLLGVASSNDPARRADATANAFRHRNRLKDVEGFLVEALYYSNIVVDDRKAIEAYENVLRTNPEDPRALNNLAGHYRAALNDLSRSEELLRRAVAGPERAIVQYSNLFQTLLQQGRTDDAAAVLRAWGEAFPERDPVRTSGFGLSFIRGDLEMAARQALALSADSSRSADERSRGFGQLARLAFWRGQLDEARRRLLDAEAAGTRAGPRLAWETRRDAAYEEALVGDPVWARVHLREALEGDSYSSLPFVGSLHPTAAMLFASVGDTEAAETVIEDWRKQKPVERRGVSEIARIGLATLHIAVAPGDTVDAAESMERLLIEMGCSEACYPFFQATLYDRLGSLGRAIELYERVLLPGYHGWGLNTGERLHAMVRLGRLYEEMGDTAKAIAAYRRLADQWAGGDARGLETVRRFEARITALDSR